jgi:hypothetical protein
MPRDSITSANASVNLTIPGVYSSGVLLQNFAVDDMFDLDPQELTESRVGADGISALGYIFHRGRMRLVFQANSESISVFYAWKSAQDGGQGSATGQRDAIAGLMTIISPALGLDVDLTTVSLKSLPPLPPHHRVAENLTVDLEFDPTWQTTLT